MNKPPVFITDLYSNVYKKYVNITELKIYQAASKSGISPQLISYSNTITGVTMVSEKWGESIKDYFSKNSLDENEKVKIYALMHDVLGKFHDIGYLHMDLHYGNFLIKVNQNDRYEIKLIDFGRSIFAKDLINFEEYKAIEHWLLETYINKDKFSSIPEKYHTILYDIYKSVEGAGIIDNVHGMHLDRDMVQELFWNISKMIY